MTMVKQMTKIEMHITLEGDDAMRILRAIVADSKAEGKSAVVAVTKEPKRKILKPAVPTKTASPVECPSSAWLNGKSVRAQDIELARVYQMKDVGKYVSGSVTAKWVAENTNKSLNQVYAFAKRYGVKWDSGYGKTSAPKPTKKGINRLLRKAYKKKPRMTCREVSVALGVTYATAYNWAKKNNKKWAKAKIGRPKGSK